MLYSLMRSLTSRDVLKDKYGTLIRAFLKAVFRNDFESADRIKVRLLELQKLAPGIATQDPRPELAAGTKEADWLDSLYRQIWGEDDLDEEYQVDHTLAEKAGNITH
jgi:hypothetical protein